MNNQQRQYYFRVVRVFQQSQHHSSNNYLEISQMQQEIHEVLADLEEQKPEQYRLIAESLSHLEHSENYLVCFQQINKSLINRQKVIEKINEYLLEGTQLFSSANINQVIQMLKTMKVLEQQLYWKLFNQLKQNCAQKEKEEKVKGILSSFGDLCQSFECIIQKMFSDPIKAIDERPLPHLKERFIRRIQRTQKQREQFQPRERSRDKSYFVQKGIKKKITKTELKGKHSDLDKEIIDKSQLDSLIKPAISDQKKLHMALKRVKKIQSDRKPTISNEKVSSYILKTNNAQICSKKTDFHRQFLNDKYIQRACDEKFTTRKYFKHEENTLKAENSLFLEDLNMLRIQKVIVLLESLRDVKDQLENSENLRKTIIEKIKKLDLKEQLKAQNLKFNMIDLDMLSNGRVEEIDEILAELRKYCECRKEERQVSSKNLKMALTIFFSSIRQQNFIKRERLSFQSFQNDLQQRVQYLRSRSFQNGEIKILNTFESVNEVAFGHIYPARFLSEQSRNQKQQAFLLMFENKQVLQVVYSMVEAYLMRNHQIVDLNKLKEILKKVFSFLDIDNFCIKRIAVDQLSSKRISKKDRLAVLNQSDEWMNKWTTNQEEFSPCYHHPFIEETASYNIEFTGTVPIYCLIRLLYAFYEKLKYALMNLPHEIYSKYLLFYYEITSLLQNKNQDNQKTIDFYCKYLRQIEKNVFLPLFTIFDLNKKFIENLQIISECKVSQMCLRYAQRENSLDVQLVKMKRFLQSENCQQIQIHPWKFDKISRALLMFEPVKICESSEFAELNMQFPNSEAQKLQHRQEKDQQIPEINLSIIHEKPAIIQQSEQSNQHLMQEQ